MCSNSEPTSHSSPSQIRQRAKTKQWKYNSQPLTHLPAPRRRTTIAGNVDVAGWYATQQSPSARNVSWPESSVLATMRSSRFGGLSQAKSRAAHANLNLLASARMRRRKRAGKQAPARTADGAIGKWTRLK